MYSSNDLTNDKHRAERDEKLNTRDDTRIKKELKEVAASWPNYDDSK